MVASKLTTILLTLLVLVLLLFSKYKRVIVVVSVAYLLYLSIKILYFKTRRVVPTISKEELRNKIQPGDLLNVSSVTTASVTDPFNLVCMFFNEEEIHTVYAVEHNSETYIINTYGTDSYKQREKTFSDPSRIIILESNKRVTGWMEPLDEFLNAEQAMKSYVRLVKTEKKAKKFDPNQKSLFHKLANAKLAHCSQAIGKYLESQGILENRSAYSDFLYYIPDVVRKQLGIISDKLYQLI